MKIVPPRIGMQTTQQKHIIPIKKASKPLFGSGVEKTIPHLLTDDFIFKASKDGIVESFDPTTDLAIIKYIDGTKDVIDVGKQMAKNSNGGFFLVNQKELLVQPGKKFKKGEIIAKNAQYFLGDKPEDVVYSTGRLTKVAVASADYTYEDSALITDTLCEDLTSKITMKKTLNLGVNANIDFLVNVGDKIKTGDSLVIFEESFEDDSINSMLAALGDEFNEFVQENSKNKLKSKYTGEVVDITIYYNRPIEDFQPSIQKILKDYIRKGKVKRKVVEDTIGSDSMTSVNLPPINMQKVNKIKGEDVDGILIELYVEYLDKAGIGDKVTWYTALKTIISDIIPPGEEPFSEFREDEQIDGIFSPLSINSRMTSDVFNALYLGKCLIELKRTVKDIYLG